MTGTPPVIFFSKKTYLLLVLSKKVYIFASPLAFIMYFL